MSLALLSDWQKLSLDEMATRLAALPKETRDQVTREVFNLTGSLKWVPNPGPQTVAYRSQADVLLYGGAGGGGKSDLILGLALTAHSRTLIIRQQYNDLDGLTERALEIIGTRRGFNGSNPPSLRTDDGRFIQFSGATMGQWQGAPFDLKACDEVAQVPEEVIRFHIGWLRSTKEGQRTRIVLGSNPPVNSVGEWLIPMFRPWLDSTHPKPAKDGELRWYARTPDGEDLEVDGPQPVQFPGEEKPVLPMSRTFIRAKLSDNPFLSRTNYASRLDALDEPYRSAIRDGNFMSARRDQDEQVIPTSWVMEAQKRWKKGPPKDLRMSAIAMDGGAGGIDRVVLSARYGVWFAPLIAVKGKDAPDGSSQAALIGRYRRDNCPVVIDVGGGYGGDLHSVLKGNGITAMKFNGSGAPTSRTRDGSGRAFENRRAEAYVRFREALNPDQKGGSVIQLPDDPELRAELTAACFDTKGNQRTCQIEPKIDVKKRLGRSPDKADAVVMNWAPADSLIRRQNASAGGGQPAQANIGYANLKRH